MLLRFALVTLAVVLAAVAVLQLIVPAVLNQPLLGWFHRESRLEKAQRLKAEATARREATQTEIEAIRMEEETNRIRNEAFEKLTRGKKA